MLLPVILGIVSSLLLAALSWRRINADYPRAESNVRAVTALVAAFCLGYLVTQNAGTWVLLALNVALIAVTWYLVRSERAKTRLGIAWIVILVAALAFSKLPGVSSWAGPGVWVGVSYFIFRLIHMVIDARNGRLSDPNLADTMVYALHPASLVAGPIDRVQRSLAEQNNPKLTAAEGLSAGVWRVLIGAFKKIVVANLLYVVVSYLDMTHLTTQTPAEGWIWLLAYTLYLYFDFAGYTDIAIGAGLMMGLRLPENFAAPYLQPSIARFWQSWHITLSNWLRDYLFFPISRSLLKRYGKDRQTPIMAASHLTTMAACGLWHGLGSGFLAWGLWHGMGLFLFSTISTWRQRRGLPGLPKAASVVITFLFVMIGWVFFSTDLGNAVAILGRLVGR